MIKNLLPHETLLEGKLFEFKGNILGNAVCDRIQHLITSHLMKIGYTSSGWEALYKDPGDGRYWELVFLQGELHGGGPPTLRLLSDIEAKTKYSL